MEIKNSVNKIVESTIKDLVDGKYQLAEKGEHSSKLEYGKNEIDIWIANGVDYCKIYSSVNGLVFPEFDAETKEIVYNIATTETDYFIKKKIKTARKNHRESYLTYKENIVKLKSLKQELLDFKK